jgi:hypothetical protein
LAGALVCGEAEVDNKPRMTFEQLFEAETPVTFINEPVDFAVDFTESKRESATERAMRIWFKHEERPVS